MPRGSALTGMLASWRLFTSFSRTSRLLRHEARQLPRVGRRRALSLSMLRTVKTAMSMWFLTAQRDFWILSDTICVVRGWETIPGHSGEILPIAYSIAAHRSHTKLKRRLEESERACCVVIDAETQKQVRLPAPQNGGKSCLPCNMIARSVVSTFSTASSSCEPCSWASDFTRPLRIHQDAIPK